MGSTVTEPTQLEDGGDQILNCIGDIPNYCNSIKYLKIYLDDNVAYDYGGQLI